MFVFRTRRANINEPPSVYARNTRVYDIFKHSITTKIAYPGDVLDVREHVRGTTDARYHVHVYMLSIFVRSAAGLSRGTDARDVANSALLPDISTRYIVLVFKFYMTTRAERPDMDFVYKLYRSRGRFRRLGVSDTISAHVRSVQRVSFPRVVPMLGFEPFQVLVS